MNAMIRIKNLTKIYNKKKVVNNLSFEVEEYEAFALLGSNGAGKSTAIKMLLGLIKPDDGTIEIEDHKRIGYSPETPFFPGFLTAAEVLRYYGQLQKIKKDRLENEIVKLLETVSLENDKTRVKNYSKGMLQRLALAQALLGDPQILVLDEPCAGLDAMGRIEMIELLKKLKARQKTILINSHILSDIEKLCDRGVIMQNGEIHREWSQRDLAGGVTLEKIFTQTIAGGGR